MLVGQSSALCETSGTHGEALGDSKPNFAEDFQAHWLGPGGGTEMGARGGRPLPEQCGPLHGLAGRRLGMGSVCGAGVFTGRVWCSVSGRVSRWPAPCPKR